MLRLEKLLVFILAIEVKKVQEVYGILCLEFIDNALLPTPIFGLFMAQFFLLLVTKQLEKKLVKQRYIERFNNTLRQRISRLVRKTLSFSKKLENHVGAIWYFVHYYNSSLLV